MTLEPLAQAPLAVQLHVAAVLPAFALGTWVIFFSRKGSHSHRLVGQIYLGFMCRNVSHFVLHTPETAG